MGAVRIQCPSDRPGIRRPDGYISRPLSHPRNRVSRVRTALQRPRLNQRLEHMTQPTPNPPAAVKSTFVTVVAWVFIVFSGFATFISLMQNLMVGFMPQQILTDATADTTFAHVMPSGPRFMFTHLRLLVLLVLVLCVLMLLSSIGLLRRRNWARLVFIGLLGVGILYNIAGLFIQQSMMSSFTASFPMDSTFSADSATQQFGQQFHQMMAGMRVFMIVFIVGFSALFGWIIVKLLSPAIRTEFMSESGAA